MNPFRQEGFDQQLGLTVGLRCEGLGTDGSVTARKAGLHNPVTARKDDVPAADQAAITNVVGLVLFSGSGGLIQTTSG